MPRLKLTPAQMMDKQFNAVMVKNMSLYDYNQKQLSERLKIAKSTFSNYGKKPDRVPLGVLRKMCALLDITDRELCQICGVEYEGGK